MGQRSRLQGPVPRLAHVIASPMLGLLRELLILARKEGMTIYRYRREHPDEFLRELIGRRLRTRAGWRERLLDGRIRRWKMRAEMKAKG